MTEATTVAITNCPCTQVLTSTITHTLVVPCEESSSAAAPAPTVSAVASAAPTVAPVFSAPVAPTVTPVEVPSGVSTSNGSAIHKVGAGLVAHVVVLAVLF